MTPNDMFEDDDYEWGPEQNFDNLEPDDEIYLPLIDIQDTRTRCPHCERFQEHSANVYDSGEPHYIMGINCEFCGRFIELDQD